MRTASEPAVVILEQAVDDAVAQGFVVRNVVRLVSKPRLQRKEMSVWTAEQLAVFLDAAAKDRFASLWRIAAFGPRRSEVLGLRWCDVDFDRSWIRIAQTRVSVDGRHVATGEPKTASGRRTVPIDPLTVGAPQKFRSRQTRERIAGERRT